MRFPFALLMAAALAACSTEVPDSGAPADTPLAGEIPAYRDLNGTELTTPAPAAGVETTVLPTDGGTAAGVPVAAATGTGLADTGAATVAPAGSDTPATTAGLAPVATGSGGSGSATADGAQPGVVSYAVATTNAVGQKRFNRSIFALPSRAARNCADYPSADAAQEAFLAAGGPERDRLNLDPDGDGFACDWDPAPYRRMVAAARG